MNIRDAILEANRVGAKYIYRKQGPIIKPTNTVDCCIIRTSTRKVPRWEPRYDDLVSVDWYVAPKECIEVNALKNTLKDIKK